jgi:hypothetical protein
MKLSNARGRFGNTVCVRLNSGEDLGQEIAKIPRIRGEK